MEPLGRSPFEAPISVPELTKLKDLPLDVVRVILTQPQIDIPDLGRVAKVSREFRVLANDDVVWQSIADRCGFDRAEFRRREGDPSIRDQLMKKIREMQYMVHLGGLVGTKGRKIAEIQELRRQVKISQAISTFQIKFALAERIGIPCLEPFFPRSTAETAVILQETANFGQWMEDNKEALLSVTELDLAWSDRKLTYIPSEIGRLVNLRELDLSVNALTELPETFWQLTSLKILDLADNKLAWLSPDLGRLIHLKKLDLSQNNLSFIPSEVGNLQALVELDVSKNQLIRLPEEINRLRHLKEFNFNKNPLGSVPDSFARFIHPFYRTDIFS